VLGHGDAHRSSGSGSLEHSWTHPEHRRPCQPGASQEGVAPISIICHRICHRNAVVVLQEGQHRQRVGQHGQHRQSSRQGAVLLQGSVTRSGVLVAGLQRGDVLTPSCGGPRAVWLRCPASRSPHGSAERASTGTVHHCAGGCRPRTEEAKMPAVALNGFGEPLSQGELVVPEPGRGRCGCGPRPRGNRSRWCSAGTPLESWTRSVRASLR
jgi:hypothetical protein